MLFLSLIANTLLRQADKMVHSNESIIYKTYTASSIHSYYNITVYREPSEQQSHNRDKEEHAHPYVYKDIHSYIVTYAAVSVILYSLSSGQEKQNSHCCQRKYGASKNKMFFFLFLPPLPCHRLLQLTVANKTYCNILTCMATVKPN